MQADNIADFANIVKNANKSNELAEILHETGKIYSFSLILEEYELVRIHGDGAISYNVSFYFKPTSENKPYGEFISIETYYKNWFYGTDVKIEDFDDHIYYDIIYQETRLDGSIYVETERLVYLFFNYDGYVHSISLYKGYEGKLNWQDIINIEVIGITE
jgi:hypothetical protein